MNPSKNNHRPRVTRGDDKLTVKSREDRSILVKNTASNSLFWQVRPEVKFSGEALIQAGSDLVDGEKLVQSLRSQTEAAEKQVVSLKIAWDECFNVYAGYAERVAIKPEDITNLGLSLLEEGSYQLAPPVSVSARWDVLTNQIRIQVRKPAGSFGCRIEISPNPITPTSFLALKGKGARRALSGYASGGWWVRALMFDNENESEYSPPVFVTVP
jgi:hypothetical protein